jgi:hypothetical protein
MKRSLLLVVLALAGVAVGGCEPAGPDTPTWEADVRPLLQARCLRCHSRDIRSDQYAGTAAPSYTFDFETWAELRDAPMTDLDRFAARAALLGVVPYVRGDVVANFPYPIMPPAPAAHLPGWQIDMLDRWTKNPM